MILNIIVTTLMNRETQHHSASGMSDPNKRYDRQSGNSRTVKIKFFLYRSNYLTVFGQTCSFKFFCFVFTDENDGKVKYRQT
jgi:hypothetical protein